MCTVPIVNYLGHALTPTRSVPLNGVPSPRPITATEIIAQAAEVAAMQEPMQALTAVYRQDAIDHIHAALETTD